MPKCILCEHAVMSVKNPSMCKCWKEPANNRPIIDAKTERKCTNYNLGAMEIVKKRQGYND